MLGFPILYCTGMRPMMFQLSGFCYTAKRMPVEAVNPVTTVELENPR